MLHRSGSMPKETSFLRFVARQPIFDTHNHIHGYELLYREGPEDEFSGDRDYACKVTLDNTLLFGIHRLTGKSLAFVNCTREALVEKLVTILPPKTTVLEIMETVTPDQAIIRACTELYAMGYRFALDDFIFRSEMEPLIALADYIKVDFMLCPPEERKIICKRVADSGIRLIAERVETADDFATAFQEGFDFFQGYFFCRPLLLATREIPPNQRNCLSLLHALHQDPLDLKQIEALIKPEAGLCFRLLRLVNSALFGIRHEVTSIMTALLAIGDKQFRKLATISIAAELNQRQTVELLVLALSRGRFCELSSGVIRQDPNEQYLLGLFSLFPAILRIKMEDILPALPFRKEILAALGGKDNQERKLLTFLEQYEQGNWSTCAECCEEMNASESDLAENYTQAVQWTEEALHLAYGPLPRHA